MDWTLRYEANELLSWVKYKADDLPEEATPAWLEQHVPNPLENSTVEIVTGVLHIEGDGTENVGWSRSEMGLTEETGWTFETRLKIVSGLLLESEADETFVEILSEGVEAVRLHLCFYTDGVLLQDSATQEILGSYLFDTSDFHTYRIASKQGLVRVYVDGVLRISGEASLGELTNETAFYGSSGLAASETFWDYIYCRTDGAFAPSKVIPDWTPDYDPNPLEESTVEISPAGQLHIVGAEEVIDYTLADANLDDAVGITLEMRAKVITGAENGLMIYFDGGNYAVFVSFTKTGEDNVIRLAGDSSPVEEEFDYTDNFHTYRVTLKDSTAKLYVDGILKLENTVPSGNDKAIILTGCDEVACEEYIDYIRYRTDGAFPPPTRKRNRKRRND